MRSFHPTRVLRLRFRRSLRRTGTRPPGTAMRACLRARARAQRALHRGDTSVWLECNAELVDIRSVAIVGLREAAPGVELVRFRCPCCAAAHMSLRFS